MKRFTTVLCSLAFLLAGFFLSRNEVSPLPHATMQASNAPLIVSPAQLPRDLWLDLVEHDTVVVTDTVFPTILDEVLIKPRKKTPRTPVLEHEPDTVPLQLKRDTLYVPALYIIIPLDSLEETNDTIESSTAEMMCE